MSTIWLISLRLLLLLFFSNVLWYQSVADAEYGGVRFELIHRHSPQLAGHIDSNLGAPQSKLERIKQLAHSDNARHEIIKQRIGWRRKVSEIKKNDTKHPLLLPLRSAADWGQGQYFVSFRLGTPPQRFVMVADTASDITWVQCNYLKCHECKRASNFYTGNIFQADHSHSFQPIPCSSDTCKLDLQQQFSLDVCPTPTTPCSFFTSYADGSQVSGFFANETVTVGIDILHRKVRLRNVVVGCSDWSNGNVHKVDGVMGLGFSMNSFAVKAAREFGHKFSYCLVDHLSSFDQVNFLDFGKTNNKTLPNMKYTKLLLGVLSSFYAVNVSGISIGEKMLDIPSELWNADGSGGVIIDSGSTLTLLAEPAYKAVTAALMASLRKFERPENNPGPFEFCFKDAGFEESVVPKFVWHFADGVTFGPPVKSYVLEVDKGVRCLGFGKYGWPGNSIIGNIMQQNHLWEFDLEFAKLGFAPSSCT